MIGDAGRRPRPGSIANVNAGDNNVPIMRDTGHAARAEIIFPNPGIWRRGRGPANGAAARRHAVRASASAPTGIGRIAAIATLAGCIVAIALLLFFGVVVDGWGAPLP